MNNCAEQVATSPPMAVGGYSDNKGARQLLPYSAAEFQRAIHFCQERLGTFHFRSGDQLLVTSLFDESYQFGPICRSLHDFGLVLLSADASFFDASRTESSMRRFDVAAVVGVNNILLEGLEALNFDPAEIFGDAIIWAKPDAYKALSKLPDLTVRLWMEIGPAVAMECYQGGGAHIDRIEWDVSIDSGEIVLTNRLPRATNFHQYHTGINGKIINDTCKCGSADPKIRLFED